MPHGVPSPTLPLLPLEVNRLVGLTAGQPSSLRLPSRPDVTLPVARGDEANGSVPEVNSGLMHPFCWAALPTAYSSA